MPIKEISVSVGRTVNIGNYESLRLDIGATATISDEALMPLSTQMEDLRKRLTVMLNNQIRQSVEALRS